jgi:glycosyltransferase involved in cell wall biosynthesis
MTTNSLSVKLLFISRAYPPAIGGLEIHNRAIHEALQHKIHVEAIINRKGKKALFWFIPFAAIKALILASRYDVILLGDGVLSTVGWFIKRLRPATPVACIIHGLDITYTNPIYQSIWGKIFLPQMDKIIAVSSATANEAMKRGIPEAKITVIPNGIAPEFHQHHKNRKKLEELLHTDTSHKIVLLTIGRLVKRKGVDWFIKRVMPEIKNQCIYLIAGNGPEYKNINKSIEDNNLSSSVYCFGLVSEELKSFLFSNADLFIQPNIKVKGDMEGFGIAVLEANMHNLPVLGSKLEGLQDSIIENQNGWLAEPENAGDYIHKINELSKRVEILRRDGDKAKDFCLRHFRWERIADKYLAVIAALIVH